MEGDKFMKFDKISTIIGKRIQSARLVKGLTQEQLAEACSISTNHISSVETGHSNCSFSLMISICNALDITPNFIFSDFISNENDSLEFMDKDILSTYLKLKPQSKDLVNDVITRIYDIQKQR